MLHKRGKYWHARVKVNGQVLARSTKETDYRRARLVEKQMREEAKLRRGLPHGSLSFDHAVVREVTRIETDVSTQAATRADYCFAAFQKWLGGDIDLDRITTQVLEDYQRQRLKEASLSTVTRELDCLVRLLRENGFNVAKPRRKPGRATEQREFTDDELVRFFSHCHDEHKTLFLLLLATGARPAEVLPSARSGHVALLKSELLPEENAVVIRSAKAKPGEKKKVRKISIPETLMQQLVAQAATVPGPHVFCPNGSLCKLFDRILVKAGIATEQKFLEAGTKKVKKVIVHKTDELGRKLTAHSFRHTFATKLARATGGDQFVLKATLGHAQIHTTDRYCHVGAAAGLVIDMERLMGKSA